MQVSFGGREPVHTMPPLLAVPGGRTQEGYLSRRRPARSNAGGAAPKRATLFPSHGHPVRGRVQTRNASARLSGCGWSPPSPGEASVPHDRNLVDPASSHTLVSKIKPCMSKYKPLYGETANGSINRF